MSSVKHALIMSFLVSGSRPTRRRRVWWRVRFFVRPWTVRDTKRLMRKQRVNGWTDTGRTRLVETLCEAVEVLVAACLTAENGQFVALELPSARSADGLSVRVSDVEPGRGGRTANRSRWIKGP
jgi:hypothetical protein